MAGQLRVYPQSFEVEVWETPEATVRVSLGDLLPLLAIAKRHNYLWLQDFLDDQVRITSDLYEILQTFRSQRRPSA